jgi:hypothetical protein
LDWHGELVRARRCGIRWDGFNDLIKSTKERFKENVSGGYSFREAPWIEEERQEGADEWGGEKARWEVEGREG